MFTILALFIRCSFYNDTVTLADSGNPYLCIIDNVSYG